MIPGYWRGLGIVRLLLLLLTFESWIVCREALAPVHHGVRTAQTRESVRVFCGLEAKSLHVHSLIQEARYDAQGTVMKGAEEE